MKDLGSWTAEGVVTIGEVQPGDVTLDDMGITLEPGMTIIKCRDAKPMRSTTVDETETIRCWVKSDITGTERMELIHVMECSKCGHTYEHVNGDYEFCPRCGRRIVEVGR